MKISKTSLKEILKSIMTEESDYQQFFRKALDKAGKSITDMSDEEKKEFFNKIDAAWNAKGEKNEGNAFGAAVVAAKKAGEDEFEVGGKTYKVEESNDCGCGSTNKSVNEGRKSKDDWGVRLVIAIANNVDAIVELVMDDKRDPKEVMSAFANPLLNSVKGVSKHNYKPNAKPAYTLKRDLQRHGDLTNQQRLDIFKSEIKKFEKIVEALIKKPTKVGVKQLGDAWRTIWNHKYGANIGLNGEGPHDNTIIEVASNTKNNENVALSRLNSIQDAREEMIGFISYKKANGENKPDSWYDRTEKSLSKKSYKDLEKLYLNLGGKKIKIESVNEARTVSKPIKVDNDTMIQIVGDDKGFRELTAALNPKTGKPIQKFGFDRGNETANSKEELIKKLQKKYGNGFKFESINEGNVKLPSSAKKFWNTPIRNLLGYGLDIYYKVPPSQWNTHPEIIDGYGRDAGVDIFKGIIRDLTDGSGHLNPKIAKAIGLPTNVSIIDYLNDGGSGLNGNKNFKKYGNWFSALYDIYDEMEKKFGKMKPQPISEADNDEKYVVIAFHEKGGGFVMTRPSSKKDAEDSARSITKSSDITKQKAVKVSDARKISGLVGKEYLKESINEDNGNLMRIGSTMMVGGDGSGMIKPAKMKLISIDYLPREKDYSYKFKGGGRIQYYMGSTLAKKLKGESKNESINEVNLNKHVWEGWTVGDFIKELEPMFDMVMRNGSHQAPFRNTSELKRWLMDNQPYYKKHIPDVYKYFEKKYKELSKNESVNEISAYSGLANVSKGQTSNVEGVKISKAMADEILKWMSSSPYAKRYKAQIMKQRLGALLPIIFGPFGIEKKLPSNLKGEFTTLKNKYSTNEGKTDGGKMAKTHVIYQMNVKLNDNSTVPGFRVSVKKGSDAENRAKNLAKKHFGNEFKSIVSMSKALNPEINNVSEVVTEGRAFINAAKKAKAEGKTEFEFNGKTYPVTIKD